MARHRRDMAASSRGWPARVAHVRRRSGQPPVFIGLRPNRPRSRGDDRACAGVAEVGVIGRVVSCGEHEAIVAAAAGDRLGFGWCRWILSLRWPLRGGVTFAGGEGYGDPRCCRKTLPRRSTVRLSAPGASCLKHSSSCREQNGTTATLSGHQRSVTARVGICSSARPPIS